MMNIFCYLLCYLFFFTSQSRAWVDCEDQPVPQDFDSRTQWLPCKPLIEKIYNEGECKWSWALATTSATTDRLCIVTNGTIKFEYSALDLLTCCPGCKKPSEKDTCKEGELPAMAILHLKNHGVVSTDCKPIITLNRTIPPCEKKCTDDKISYYGGIKKLPYSDGLFVRFDREKAIKQVQIEIMSNGPLVMEMKPCKHFRDFFASNKNAEEVYNSNECDKETPFYHAAKIIGWGNSLYPYWLCANSWGKQWGNNGFFKILRGKNLLHIEEYFVMPYHFQPREPPTSPYASSPSPTLSSYAGQFKSSVSSSKMASIPKNIFLFVLIMFK